MCVTVESLESHCNSQTVPLVQWSTRLLPVMRDPGSIPRGVLMWNQDSPVSIFSLHWRPRHDWSLWPCLRRASSWTVIRPSCRQCDNPTWSHTALLSQFHACCRSSFRLYNQHSWLLGGGGALWRACNLTAIHTQFHWFSGPLVCLLSWGNWVQSPGGFLCEIKILLLALSHYITILGSTVGYAPYFYSSTVGAMELARCCGKIRLFGIDITWEPGLLLSCVFF